MLNSLILNTHKLYWTCWYFTDLLKILPAFSVFSFGPMQWRPEPYLTWIYQNLQFWQFPESFPTILKGTFQQMFLFLALDIVSP